MDDKRIVKFSRLTSHQISFRYFYYTSDLYIIPRVKITIPSPELQDKITINIYPRSTGFAGNWWLFHRRINFPRIFASRRAVRYTSSVSDNVSPRGNREPPTLGALFQQRGRNARPPTRGAYLQTDARARVEILRLRRTAREKLFVRRAIYRLL